MDIASIIDDLNIDGQVSINRDRNWVTFGTKNKMRLYYRDDPVDEAFDEISVDLIMDLYATPELLEQRFATLKNRVKALHEFEYGDTEIVIEDNEYIYGLYTKRQITSQEELNMVVKGLAEIFEQY